MPMVPEAVIAMLACARLGAIHSVVFGGFASNELAKRIDDAKPKLILSASCGIEVNRVIPYKPLLDGAIELAQHKVSRCVILQRETLDRKGTRLNSSHSQISYAVFCLKKKKQNTSARALPSTPKPTDP